MVSIKFLATHLTANQILAGDSKFKMVFVFLISFSNNFEMCVTLGITAVAVAGLNE